jgi:hypothetical protein
VRVRTGQQRNEPSYSKSWSGVHAQGSCVLRPSARGVPGLGFGVAEAVAQLVGSYVAGGGA